MRVAVTGGTGFIGSHVVDRLVAAGHEVVVLDLRPPHRTDVAFSATDIVDVASVERGLTGCDAVFHLAGVANVDEARDDPERTVALNVLGTATVWEAARRCGVARAVLASTVWVYGAAVDGEGDLAEDAAFDASRAGHIYTSSKLSAELVVRSFHELYGQEFTILRYGIPYGPRMRDELVTARFVRAALAGDPITIHGDGSQTRNYVYVEDMAEAHVLALGDAGANGIFNLEGAEEVSVRQLVTSVVQATGSASPVTFGDARPGDFAGRPISGAHTAEVLGWRPTVRFEEGLHRYIEWYRERERDATPVAMAPAAAPVRRSLRSWATATTVAVAMSTTLLPALASGQTRRLPAGLALLALTPLVAATVATIVRRRVQFGGAIAPALTTLVAIWLLGQVSAGAIVAVAVVLGAAAGVVIGGSGRDASHRTILGGAAGLGLLDVAARWAGGDLAVLWVAAVAQVVAIGVWMAATSAAASGARSLRGRVVTAGALGAATMLTASVVGATSASATWFGAVVAHGDRSSAAVALTIDATNDAATTAIADALQRRGVRATFFFRLRDVARDPSVARAVIARGQDVGTVLDRRLVNMLGPWPDAVARAEGVWRRAVGQCPAFVRPPNADHTPLLAREASRQNVSLVTWDDAVAARREGAASAIAGAATAGARRGSIIRIDASGAAASTATSIGPLLDGLRSRGLAVHPLSAVLHRPVALSNC